MIISFFIIIFLQIMNVTIDFNNQRLRMAVEIHDITIDNLLPSKLKAVQMIMS